MCRGDNLIRLESEQLVLAADPACGGKLRSLLSKASGREFLYQDRRTRFEPEQGYSYHDLSGWDECFPSVAACGGIAPDGGAYDYPDHGALWQRRWEVQKTAGALTMSCVLEGYRCSFTRCCSFADDSTLRLDYRIHNHGGRSLPYVYSAHPLLAVDASTRVVLPPEMTRVFNYLSAPGFGLHAGTWFDVPSASQRDLTGPFSAARQTFIKLFSDRLASGGVIVEYPDSAERLVFRQDTATLPHVGFLAQQGYDALGDGYFAGECLLACEPTTGIGDDLSTCVETGTLRTLAPGAVASFWISVTVEAM